MKHLKKMNELFLWDNLKVKFKNGENLAKEYLRSNPEVLDQIKSNIENLNTDEQIRLLSIKDKLNSLVKNPDATEEIIGEDVLENQSKISKILEKIGKWLGIGTLLVTIFGGIVTIIYGLLQAEPLIAIIGFIVFFIGTGINSMKSSD